jgi:type III restriction enzyme
MSKEKKLFEVLDNEFGARNIRRTHIPLCISNNLNPKYPLREYQTNAFQYFINFLDEDFPGKKKLNPQLLFHMATGSGKTLVMAGLILELYSRGFNNFLFFVNSTNIIQKTKENFLSESSSKYLFNESITINNRIVNIRKVESFSDTNDNAINILFTTIQDLHNQISVPRENGFTLEDIRSKKIVLISDEAHHINVQTKRRMKLSDSIESAQLELLGGNWESSVEQIFLANPENMLLEFTATMDLDNSAIYSKYNDKIIFDYPLREFRKDGYSKEVSVEVFDSKDPLERAFVAVLLSQYRKRLLLKHRIGNKPVILFKSKTIEESRKFQLEFSKFIKNIEKKDLEKFLSKDKPQIVALKNFLTDSLNDLDSFVLELKEDFSSSRHLVVNSKDESEEKQLALNSLEDEDNGYRCIFAVDKLNEGWDVLNLFDIVRLYDTRDPTGNTGIGTKKVGTTTMSEAQLIGRGARYFPFKLQVSDELYKRKFDFDLDHELRICETLYYHSAHNPKYVQELNSALHEIGIKAKESTVQDLLIKEDFKETKIYKRGAIYLNEKRKRTSSEAPEFKDYIRGLFKVRLDSGLTKSILVFNENSQNLNLPTSNLDISLEQIDRSVLFHAISSQPSLTFGNLKRIFPGLRSLREFIESRDYIASLRVEVNSIKKSFDEFDSQDKLEIAQSVINEISERLSTGRTDYFGTKDFLPHKISEIFRDKRMNFNIDPGTEEQIGRSMTSLDNSSYYLDLASRKWYAFNDCFGTSEEKLLVKYIDKKIPELKDRFSDVYLLRNEKFFKIYDFKNGDATEPDFVLFLTNENQTRSIQYQIFIEPKGGHLVAKDQWKDDLLTSLKDEAKVVLLTQSEHVRVWGLPFYQNEYENDFETAFNDLLSLS